MLSQQRAGLLQVARRGHLVAFAQQRQFVQRAQIGLIVNDQDVSVRFGAGHGEGAAWLLLAGVLGGWVQNITLNSLPGCIFSPKVRLLRSYAMLAP